MKAHFKHLGVKVVISAPYSYHGAPVEMWFSRLKTGDWNPQNVPTGKK